MAITVSRFDYPVVYLIKIVLCKHILISNTHCFTKTLEKIKRSLETLHEKHYLTILDLRMIYALQKLELYLHIFPFHMDNVAYITIVNAKPKLV